MMNDNVVSKIVKAGQRSYFFDLKKSKNNKFYLTIKESKHDNGNYVNSRILIFQEDIAKIKNVFDEIINVINNKEQVPF